MEYSTDVEITGVLSGAVIGAMAALLSMDQEYPQTHLGKITRMTGGLILGLASGLVAAWLTRPLDGCSIVKLKDSNLHLVWGTDDVTVRIVILCGLVGTIWGAAAQGIRVRRTCARNGSNASCPVRPVTFGNPMTSKTRPIWITILEAACLGLLGGAFLVGLTATLILMTIRTMKQFP